MGVGGLFLVFEGLVARENAPPPMRPQIPPPGLPFGEASSGASIAGAESSRASTGDREVATEWRTLQADRQLDPRLGEVGSTLFHAGLGLAVAAWVLASRVSLGRSLQHPWWARILVILWLLPAAWALWRIGARAGPGAASAPSAMLVFRAMAPVYALFLVLGLYFTRSRPRETLRGSLR
ncbi:hypothetical protein Poly30_26860 [Planctomycetes bacterium Poly30]|uniref:Uncharacterized protein n=2 Tax=Saltatorellus ferox TaxID=2528018 RepID=A0A518ESU2_9BACT|nr:hypothetical protein Poly30_26860 [Planctomycetes bacterium Poly30]